MILIYNKAFPIKHVLKQNEREKKKQHFKNEASNYDEIAEGYSKNLDTLRELRSCLFLVPKYTDC